jgi:endonuclease YncB( thermonuclease family)
MRRFSEQQNPHGTGLSALSGLLGMSATIFAMSALAEPAAQGSSCPEAGTSRAAIANIDEKLEITLKDGRTLRLTGLEPPRPTPDGPDFNVTARDAFAAQSGSDIAFVPLAEKPDRWGRIPAFVFFDPRVPGGPTISAANFLLAGGFARFMPEPEARPCRTTFLAAEAKARSGKLGLWRDPFYAIIAAMDRDAFAEKAATNVVVKGRLVGVDNGPLRTYLEFAPRHDRAFSVAILQPNVRIFAPLGSKLSYIMPQFSWSYRADAARARPPRYAVWTADRNFGP